ncbi:MAG: 4-(cytidine 5'-diphospho)-2-C-methyl-D-erythritol kinase [Deltaproteobacteria bacterium]|nr:4-(cytidine 5'-diphospho)-2-C-methyl-D-erythritol kinase [Deltaproteobacteria bacterium]
MKKIEVKAPAKVNTLLRVIGKRPNGYHDLEMVMVPLSLADELTLTSIPSGIEISVDGQSDDGMLGEKNLAYRAAVAFKEAACIKDGVRIDLKKRIPVAAGLGGGSSDAASVLIGLNDLWGTGWSPDQLAGLGVKLGADVPFFCYQAPAYVEGIGDIVTPYTSFPNLSFLLINPNFAVSTPWVYQQIDLELTQNRSDARVRPQFQAFSDVLLNLHNDLEVVTIESFSEIARIKDMLMKFGAAGALMSGSGPTVFGVFENRILRDEALTAMPKNNCRFFAAEGIFSGNLVKT